MTNSNSNAAGKVNAQHMKVIVIEDEQEIREFLVSQFQEAGIETFGLPSAVNAISSIDEIKPTVILLDHMMPGKSGAELITELRRHNKHSEIPILMVTGLNSEDEKVAALELGADDYVTKPFSIREVVARAQALHRRSQSSHKEQQQNLSYKALNILIASHKALLNEVELLLTLTEYKILCELVRSNGQVLTRDRLRERALGNLNVTDRTIDVHMASLRKKLGDLGNDIETVRGVGYRMHS